MGFLDRLFGRTKDAAGDVADKAAPAVDTVEEGASQAWDTTKDTATGLTDKAKDEAGDVQRGVDAAADDVKDAAADARSPSDSGSSAA